MELLIRLSTLAATLLLCCCGDRSAVESVHPVRARPRHMEKPPSTYHDTLAIMAPAAVFYSPDSIQLDKVRDTLDTSVYKAIMHDYFYQVRNARKVVGESRPALPIIDAKNYRYLLFWKRNESSKCVDLDRQKDLYGILLFDGKKDPVPVDMPNINTALGFYFKDQ